MGQSIKKAHHGNAFSGIMFITGTTIGAGMLGIPFMTSLSGFLPGVVITTLCWLFMWLTGLLFFEVALWMPEGANVLSMAERFLGKSGKVFGGVVFLFLSYGMLIAYFDGASPLLISGINRLTGWSLPEGQGFILLTLLFGGVVFVGTWVADRINTVLVAGMLIAYVCMMGAGVFDVESSRLQQAHWSPFLFAAPVLFSAFGYHSIIPSMTGYLRRNVKAMRWALFVGTLIPFLVYTLWNWLILGSIPADSLAKAWEGNEAIASIIIAGPESPLFAYSIQFFAFFAIVTSLMGVSISVIDFLGDGFKMERTGVRRLLLCSLAFIPPSFIAWQNPGIFLRALGMAGGFGEASFDAILPLSMVWVGRYKMKLAGAHQVPGGKITLVVLATFTALIIGMEVIALVQ